MALKSLKDSSVAKHTFTTFFFGALSAVLGLIQLNTPGFEGSYSDLREIALLLCIFHIRKPLFIIPLCFLTLFGLQVEIRLIAVFISHAIPLFIMWYLYAWIKKMQLSNSMLGIVWCLLTVFYYVLFLYPVLIISYNWFGINTDVGFIKSYNLLFVSGTFEMVTTALITSLYLVQLNIRRSVQLTNRNLEKLVNQRTQELTNSNEELHSMNENLEQLVKERTAKIKMQLNQILNYAHMNSHEVRAPLARILGLMILIKEETNEIKRTDLLEKLNTNSIELDDIVRKMNRLLEQEVPSEESE